MRLPLKLFSLFFLSFILLNCSSSAKKTGSDSADTEQNNSDPVTEILQYLEHYVVQTDTDGDGTVNESSTYYLDQKERLIYREIDSDNDGVTDGTEEYIFENGLVKKSIFMLPGNFFSNSFTYDENGNLIDHLIDKDDDGSINWAYHSVYNAQNMRTLLQYDMGNDGVLDTIYTWDYDVTGLLNLHHVTDAGADGTPNYIEDREFNAQGLVTKLSVDNDGDALYENINTYTYDADGLLISSTTDVGNDGIVDLSNYYTYDDAGRLVKAEYDTNNDGIIDSYYIVEFSPLPEKFATGYRAEFFDDGDVVDGEVATKLSNYTGGGVLTSELTFTYAEDGSEYIRESDNDGDGTVDSVEGYKFNEMGSIVEYYVDNDNDGHYEYYEMRENFYADLPSAE